MQTILVRPDRFKGEAGERIKAAGTPEGRFLRVPVALYEAARAGRLRRPEEIGPEYDPARDKDKGRCCS